VRGAALDAREYIFMNGRDNVPSCDLHERALREIVL